MTEVAQDGPSGPSGSYTGTGRAVLRAAVVGLALLLAGLTPQAALAGVVSETDGMVAYGTPGMSETNNVTVAQTGGGDLTITETGAGATMTDGPPGDACTVAGNTATCIGATGFVLDLGRDGI